MIRKTKIALIVVISLLISGGLLIVLINNTATSETDAKNIALDLIHDKYHNIDLDKYDIKVQSIDNNKSWIVFFMLEGELPGTYALGGGGPEITIDKSSGEIIKIAFSK